MSVSLVTKGILPGPVGDVVEADEIIIIESISVEMEEFGEIDIAIEVD